MATQNLGRVGLVLKGEWDSSTQYTALDVVSHDGNAWAAKQNSTNVEPTTGNSNFWQLFSNNATLVATVQGYKEDAASSAAAAAASAQKAEGDAEAGTNAMNGIAPNYSNLTFPISKGTWCWYSGGLYRAATDISASESWTASHWSGSVLSNDTAADIEAIERAIYAIVPEDLSGDFIKNNYIPVSSDTQVGDTVTISEQPVAGMGYQIINCAEGDYFSISGRAVSSNHGYAFLDGDNRYITGGGVIYQTTFTAPQAGKLILNINTRNDYYAYRGRNAIEEARRSVRYDTAQTLTQAEQTQARANIAAASADDFNALEDSVNANITAMQNDVSIDESILYRLSPRFYTVERTNKRLALGSLSVGDIADLTPVSSTNYGYLIIGCGANEVFYVSGNAGSGNVPWACLDNENTVLSIASKAIVTREKIVTPEGTTKIAITLLPASGQRIQRGENVVGILNGEDVVLSLTVTNGQITTNGATTTSSSYRRTPDALLLKAGQTITMQMSCGSSNSVLSEWSENDNFVQSLLTGNGAATYVYTTDRDMLVKICYYNSDGFIGYLKNSTPTENAQKISENMLRLNAAEYEWERVLNSVCCIGDSLTRGAYYVNGHDGGAIDQNYPYFFGKQTGLTVQNEGLSGSSPSSRWSYFSTFDFTPYNAFFVWWGTNGGLTDTLADDGVIDADGNLIADYTAYADTNTGDYCKTIGKIISQVPHAKIFLATIFTTAATGGAAATNAVIRKIADLYPNHVMGIVNCNDGTLYTLASKKLTPSWVHIGNTTHFSMVGNYYLAVHWIKAVRAIVAANPAKFEDIMEDILA